MLSTNYTQDLLDLQDVKIEKIEQFTDCTHVYIYMDVKPNKCPRCGEITAYVHDYRVRIIKDIAAYGKNTVLHYKQRRYVCKHCGKRFSEKNSFSPKYYRITYRLLNDIFKKLECENSFTRVADLENLSVSSIIRYFDILSYKPPKNLPEVLAIDEFKGNTGNEKYQAILTDPKNGVVLDILPNRKSSHIYTYIKQWECSDRNKVKFFVSDMWKPYSELADTYLKEAVQLVDKYHYIRQIIWAFERVRKKVQKKYGKKHRLLFKHSKKLLTIRQSKLKPEHREQVEYLLYLSEEIRTAYLLKEEFYEILDCTNREAAKELMSEWILSAEESGLKDYTDCAKTLKNWSKSILNTFDHPYTNGFTEGCNNKIKVLKRNAYGYRNFKRFRNRILHMFNYKKNTEKVVA